MRILQVIGSVNPQHGGVVEAVRLMSHAMKDLGHETEIATADTPDAPWLDDFGFQVHALGPGTQPYQYCRKLGPWLKANTGHFDAVVANGLWNYTSVAVAANTAPTTPYFVFVHGMLDPWFKQAFPLKHLAKQIYWLVAEGRALANARAVLFTAKDEQLRARGTFWGYKFKEALVRLGIAPPPAEEIGRQAAAFFDLVPGVRDRAYLLFLGRLHPKKGCDIALEAFAAVANKYPDLDLVFAGPDQVGWRSELEELAGSLGITDRVHWTGMLSGDGKWGAFRQCEAFVLPSHQENFGVVVAEAMACQRPVLISSKINIWREVVDSGSGLASSDDIASFTAQLGEFLKLMPEQRAAMGETAYQCYLEKFQIEQAARHYAVTLEQLIRSPEAAHG
ncbi:glycosyltransferase [Novosphingobium beihaiensis]|uniref:Glycosyltransferase n=1 Tax=Novosphingobium beihaiensis TaxID=2930389 RepID=A0ABT0BNN0_9SPHN|nr:glycosyltransferase [Novosphingobium beihaiensis]MCJ2186656.1 glycosyltransferase [Novosphingobium beihaiensis]